MKETPDSPSPAVSDRCLVLMRARYSQELASYRPLMINVERGVGLSSGNKVGGDTLMNGGGS